MPLLLLPSTQLNSALVLTAGRPKGSKRRMLSGACATMWRLYVTVEETRNFVKELGGGKTIRRFLMEKVTVVQELWRSNLVLTGKADEDASKDDVLATYGGLAKTEYGNTVLPVC